MARTYMSPTCHLHVGHLKASNETSFASFEQPLRQIGSCGQKADAKRASGLGPYPYGAACSTQQHGRITNFVASGHSAGYQQWCCRVGVDATVFSFLQIHFTSKERSHTGRVFRRACSNLRERPGLRDSWTLLLFVCWQRENWG